MKRFWCLLGLLVLFAIIPVSTHRPGIQIGSKKFTESVVLGEILSGLAENTNGDPSHFRELGGTRLVFNALVRGEIDAYPEYTGTLRQEIFADQAIENLDQLRAVLARQNILMTEPLGFNNTYAIGMRKARARELGVTKYSDLGRFPNLNFGKVEPLQQISSP